MIPHSPEDEEKARKAILEHFKHIVAEGQSIGRELGMKNAFAESQRLLEKHGHQEPTDQILVKLHNAVNDDHMNLTIQLAANFELEPVDLRRLRDKQGKQDERIRECAIRERRTETGHKPENSYPFHVIRSTDVREMLKNRRLEI